MIQSKHCDLCKYEKRSLKKGLACGLTNKKPDFKTICDNFKITNATIKNYKKIVGEFENLRIRKKVIYFKFYILIVLGLSLILFGNFYLKEIFESGNYSLKFMYFIYGSGVTFITIAYSVLNKCRGKFNSIEDKKRKIEEILELYEMEL